MQGVHNYLYSLFYCYFSQSNCDKKNAPRTPPPPYAHTHTHKHKGIPESILQSCLTCLRRKRWFCWEENRGRTAEGSTAPQSLSPLSIKREQSGGIDLNFPLIFPGNSMNSGLQMCLCFKQTLEVSWENYQYRYWKPESCFFHVVLTMQQIVFDMLLVTQKFEIWLRRVIN